MNILRNTAGRFLILVVALVFAHALAAQPATTQETTTLKPIEDNWQPVDGKSTVVFKTTPQGKLKINLFFPQGLETGSEAFGHGFLFGGGLWPAARTVHHHCPSTLPAGEW